MARSDGRMAIGINPEAIVDWSPAWTFLDVFQASRPWISQLFNTSTFSVTYDPALAPQLDLDARGTVRSLQSFWRNGVQMRQYASTLIFRDTAVSGAYPGGIYWAEWDGIGELRFSFDARVLSSGTTAAGRRYAQLQVTPSSDGILVTIESTDPTNPVRDINLWMPDYQGQSFRGKRWQPGASFSPFHPLYLERLAPFSTLRFMAMQETNSSDIVTWADRRPVDAVRQSSGAEGTPSEPRVNGMSVEYMVQLANDLDADPWFNMPHQADDDFVRSFATYVKQHLEPGRRVYVEWSNELWNFGYGFEASQWVAARAQAEGLSTNPDAQWIIAGRQAGRDMRIWSEVFAGVNDKQLVRVAAGWAAVDYVSNEIAANMDGAFDAIAIAPYITPTDAQRARYSSATTVDQVLADTRSNIEESLRWTRNHRALADAWSLRLGRPIELLAYEGGPHLDGRNQPYQPAFLAATKDPRIGPIYADYLRGLDQAGLDLYLDFQFTSQDGENAFGDFGKLHRMDQPLATAHSYNVLRAAADGSLWAPQLQLEPATVSNLEGAAGSSTVVTFTIRRSGELTSPAALDWAVVGHGSNPADGSDFAGGVLPSGSAVLEAGASSQTISITIRGDNVAEQDEQYRILLSNPVGASFSPGADQAIGTIRNDDLPLIQLALSPASVSEDGTANLVYSFSRTGPSTSSLSVNYSVSGSAIPGTDYTGIATTPTIKTLTFAAGSSTATVSVDPKADTTIEADETVVLSLISGSGYNIGSSAALVGTIRNDDLPQINLALSPASVTEDGTANLVYSFSRTGPSTHELMVNYSVGGTAAAGSDYSGLSTTSASQSIRFAAGSSVARLTLDPTADRTVEPHETVALTLVAGDGYTVGTTTAITGTISNDDVALPSISLVLSASAVPEDGSSNLVYTFLRSAPSTTALTVNYSVGGTATAGIDYSGIASTAAIKTVNFAAGATSVSLSVDPRADTEIEPDETVSLTLVAGTGYTIATSTAVVGTISNDDPRISLSLANTSVREDQPANLVYTFTRTGPTSNSLTVNYSVGGSASLGVDYTGIPMTSQSRTVTFAAGSATAMVSVDPSADGDSEADETVSLTLTAGSGYTIDSGSAVTGILINDDISSNRSYTLSPGESSLRLIGTGRINGTGNSLNNLIVGNASNNRLAGLAGKDILTGAGTTDRDVFLLAALSDSLLLEPGSGNADYFDEITDFNRRDRILAPYSISLETEPLSASIGTATSSSSAALANLLTSSAFAEDSVVAFSITGFAGTFLAMNDARAGFQADTDAILFLRNYAISSTNPVDII